MEERQKFAEMVVEVARRTLGQVLVEMAARVDFPAEEPEARVRQLRVPEALVERVAQDG
jgi:hypothetical protein